MAGESTAAAEARRVQLPPLAVLPSALLTVLTVLLAWLTGHAAADAILRPCYYGLLWWFFGSIGRRYRDVCGLPMRLVETGFLVLAIGSTVAAVLQATGADSRSAMWAQLHQAAERGALFLLGLSLIGYGLLSWIPEVLANHRRLGQNFQQTSGRLQVAETARSRMEQQLVDADRLGLLGELAAGVAHDLRNPLAIIKGTADSLRRRDRSPAAFGEHLDVIQRAIERADRTISALIDLGRPRKDRPRALCVQEVVLPALELVRLECRRHGVAVQTAGTDTATVVADPVLLQQALLNLLLNAVQASHERGTVCVRARPFALGAASGVAIAVEDRGKGLPAAVRSQLFAPFFTTRRDGTGLGLLSSRRIATELGGRLGLYPRAGGGARALLLLPTGAVAVGGAP